MNGLALCAGIGGLELGIKRAIPEYRTVCYVERDPYAAGVLATRMEEKAICSAPIWDDIESFSGIEWRGIVDCITAGFPCQPVSVAGRRKFLHDERWIWPHLARIIGEVEPACIFLENVSGLISLGLEYVIRDLASMGYDAKWCCITAESSGAPHERERVFIFSYANSTRRQEFSWSAALQERPRDRASLRSLGWPTEPGVGRVDDGVPYRVDRIKCLGNAVVPAQAELAWRILTR